MAEKSLKFFLTVLVISVFVSFSCFGTSITAIGYGETKEEALRRAREELAKSIQVTVSGVRQVKVLDTGTAQIASFKDDFSETTNLEMLGVKVLLDPEFVQEPGQEGQYQAMVGIDGADSMNLYITKLHDLLHLIDNTEHTQTSSIEIKKNILREQIESYNQFDAYKYLALQLGATPQQIPLPQRTKIGLQIEYYDLLEKEQESRIAEDMKVAEVAVPAYSASRVDSKKQSTEILLADGASALRPELKELMRLMLEQSSESKGLSLKRPHLFAQKWEGLQTVFEQWYVRYAPIAELLRDAEETRREFTSALADGGEIVGQEYTITADIEELEFQLLETHADEKSQVLHKQFVKALREFEKIKFETSIQHGELEVFFDLYDETYNAWPTVIRVDVLGEKISLDYFLSYKNATGKSIPSSDMLKNYTQWRSFLDTVDILNLLFTEAPNEILDIKAVFSISPAENNMILHSLEIFRKDLGKTVFLENVRLVLPLEEDLFVLPSSEIMRAIRIHKEHKQEKERRKRLAYPKLYTRKGFTLQTGVGITNLDYQNPGRSDLNHTVFAVGTADAIASIRNLCFGAELELLVPFHQIILKEPGAEYYAGGLFSLPSLQYGVYGIIGYSYPIELRNGTIVPFLDLRISPLNSYGGISAGLGTGVEFNRITSKGKTRKFIVSYYWKMINPTAAYGNSYLQLGIGI